MTQKERNKLFIIYEKLNNIYGFHNKNLTNDQYYKIGDCLELLQEMNIKD